MPRNKVFSRVHAASVSGFLVTLSAAVPLTARAADKAADGVSLQEVVVTGSRLGSSGFSAPTPVTVVGTKTIEQRAPANIADVINEQPAFKVSSSDTTRGGTQPGSGQQVLNLRGLGAVRTLVLLNGRRLAPTLWDGTVDTAIIPTGLVERTEVVSGGASAAYGSDAVAGVVNIILRDSMHGVRVTAQTGYTEYGSGKQYTGTLAGGTSFFDDRLNILGGVDYNDSKTVPGPYGKAWGKQEIGNLVPSPAQRTANPSLPQTVIGTNVEPGSAAPGGLLQVTNTSNNLTPGVAYTFDANGNPVLFNQGALYGNPGNANLLMTGSTANYGYSGNNINALRAPTRRTDFYGRMSFAITDHVKAYLDVNKALVVVDPFLSALYISQGGANGTAGMPQLTISKTNPFVTPATLALVNSSPTLSASPTFALGRINTEFGLGSPFGIPGVAYKATTNVGRVLAGVQGDFGKDWKWDAFAQRGTTELTTYRQEYSPSALQYAVDNCTGTVGLNAAQQAALATYQNMTGKTCVPFNPFGVGRNPVAAQNYFMQMIWTKQELEQNVFAASINGTVMELPAGPLAVATGAEYRRDQARGTVDNVTAIGNLLSNNFQPLARDNNSSVSNTVKEAFVELGAPLLKDRFLARSLDLNAAVRRTDYSQSGVVSTWKAGFTWEPIEDLRVRVVRSRDIRAPNLNDIYFQGGLGISGNLINHVPKGVVGFNGTVNLNPAGLANNTNLNVAQNGASGGGSLLKPEIADTTTAGLVWRRGGFDASLDYYKIVVKGVINTPNSQGVIDGCAAGDPRLCQMITFDSNAANLNSNGGLALVAPTALNLITQSLLGYDFEMGYRMQALGGNFSVRGLLNYQPRNRSLNPIFNVTTDNANVLNNQPRVGYNLSLGFQKGKWNTDVQIRGFTGRRGNAVLYNADGSVAISPTISNTSLYTVLGPEDQGYVASNAGTVSKNRFAGQYLVNPTVNYEVTEKIGVFLAVDNLFDVDPAALSTSPAYDLIGRRYRAGVRAAF